MRRELPLADHTRLIVQDRDESRVRAGALWEPHDGEYLGGQFYLKWNQFDLTRSAIGAMEFRSRGLVTARPEAPVYRTSFQIAGNMRHRIAGAEVVSGPAIAAVHRPRAPLTLEMAPQKSIFAGFEEAGVEAALRGRTRQRCRTAGPANEFALDRGPGQAFHSFLLWLIGEIDSRQSTLVKSTKSLAAIDRTLLELFADALVGGDSENDKPQHNRVGEFRLRQLESWIEANIDEPFGLTRMAEVAGSDVRGVREAFLVSRGVTPTEYVMNARLDRARRLLLAAEPGVTITSVCVACGIFHFGRFSIRYKARFGEMPSQTLARELQKI
ncbi:MAG: helix-turn-helix domain-containing protein [Rhodoblastus sp.]